MRVWVGLCGALTRVAGGGGVAIASGDASGTVLLRRAQCAPSDDGDAESETDTDVFARWLAEQRQQQHATVASSAVPPTASEVAAATTANGGARRRIKSLSLSRRRSNTGSPTEPLPPS